MVFALTAWAFTYIMDHISDFVNLASVVLLCGLFLPLTAGLWWSRATSVGATMSSEFPVPNVQNLERKSLQSQVPGVERLSIPSQRLLVAAPKRALTPCPSQVSAGS